MHLMDGVLSPPIWISFWVVIVVVLILAYFRLKKVFQNEESDKIVPYIGVLAAVIFAFQFVNYPIPGGTSGHLVGGTLVAVILGPWASVIVLFLILVIQSFFGDGGITALGTNAFNMGIIGGIVGFYIVLGLIKIFNRTSMKKEFKMTISTAIGSYIAILLAALACGIELGLSGAIPMELAITAMVFWHIFIGIGEAIISGLIIFYIYKAKPSLIITESTLGVK
jgi:cobalt/nickel transport system permease protein